MGATTEDRYFALIEGSKRFVRTGCGVLRCGGVLRHAAKTMQHAAMHRTSPQQVRCERTHWIPSQNISIL